MYTYVVAVCRVCMYVCGVCVYGLLRMCRYAVCGCICRGYVTVYVRRSFMMGHAYMYACMRACRFASMHACMPACIRKSWLFPSFFRDGARVHVNDVEDAGSTHVGVHARTHVCVYVVALPPGSYGRFASRLVRMLPCMHL